MSETAEPTKSILDPTRYFAVAPIGSNNLAYNQEARTLAGNPNNNPFAVGDMMSGFAKAVLVESGRAVDDSTLIKQGREVMYDLANNAEPPLVNERLAGFIRGINKVFPSVVAQGGTN
jgi:hypothetical protein